MSSSVVTNLSSLNAQAQLDKTGFALQQTLTRLSSGLRINSAADDAAGLAVANRFRMDNAGLQVGIRSANDAISRLQIEDGTANNVSSLLDRALTLAAQAASTTFLGSRTTLDTEFQSVLSEITREATSSGLETSNTNLNNRSVFVGNTSISTANNVTYVSFALSNAIDAEGLGISTQNITSQGNAVAAVAALQTAVGTLGSVQGKIGSAMNRLQYAIAQSQSMSVAVAASESRIRDANIAEEAANLTKFNILNQSGLAALAQANQSASSVLSLLR
jgi:flagellin